MKKFFSDTFAQVTFSIIIGAFIELFIVQLTVEQSIRIRASALPIAVLIGRPYGIYRDFLCKRFQRSTKLRFRRLLVDAIANLTFQIPIYTVILAANGAFIKQIAAAVASVALFATISGRPFGIYLVLCRKLFRVSSASH
jgi:hypothetical protein